MRPSNAPSKPTEPRTWLPKALFIVVGIGLLIAYPPFRVISLTAQNASTTSAPPLAAFDPRTFAAHFWDHELPASIRRATDATELKAALDREPQAAADRYAKRVGLGGIAYYFVAGEGRVIEVEKKTVRIAVGDTEKSFCVIDTGPVFGNALRDGTGLLDMNTFPGSAEFNALSAELNGLVEARVLPLLKGKVVVGARVRFAGCAEISGNEGDPRPLQLVPFQIEVR